MKLDADAIEHYLSPTLFLAYGWAYAFTVCSTAAGLNATRLWPMWLTWPAILLGFGALFAIVIGLRPLLLDVFADLGIREKFGIFLITMCVFAMPKAINPGATLADCLIALQLPLVAQLIRRENFLRLYALNFILLALAVFVRWQDESRGGFAWALCVPVFLAGCFAADHFFFEIDRYSNLAARPFVRPFLVGIAFGLVSVAGGSLLYAVTPEFTMARRSPAPAVVARPGGVQTVSAEALVRLVWDAFILLVMVVLALVVLQWVKKQLRRRTLGEEIAMGGGVMKMVRKAIRPKPRPPEMPRGFSPREQILRGYWSWCDEMERFGLAREQAATPREYAGTIRRREPAVSAGLDQLTSLFEWAKYDRRQLRRRDAEAFFSHSRRVIEHFLEVLQAR